MNKAILSLALAAGICLAAEERNTTRQSFAVVPLSSKLIVDTVDGNIIVTGYQGAEIQVTVNERWRGDDDTKLAQARREVRLDVKQEGNTVRLYVDGPFRCNGNGNCGGGNGDRGYSARFDFDVKVPVQAILDLRTVNGGRVEVDGVDGDFSVRNVNGSINMKNIGGSGGAHTVNGRVAVTFRRNPKSPSSFKSVNGEIDAAFQPDLSADLRLKTFNGDAWTDFPATGLPSSPEASERQGGRFVYKRDRQARLRVGSGGPEHSFETLNGSIQITGKGQ